MKPFTKLSIPYLISFLLICILPFEYLFAQIYFEKSYGGTASERGTTIDLTTDGGYIITGSSSSFTSDQDMYLLKLNKLGSIVWSKVYHSFFSFDRLHGVKHTPDGGYYLTGYIEGGFGFIDHAIMRIDSIGNIIWAKHFGGAEAEELREVCITLDGGALVSGYNASYGPGAKEIQAIKFSPSGDVEWAKTYGNIYEDFNASILILSDGNFLLVGATDVSGFYDVRPLLIKTDTLGNIIWAKIYSGVIEDWARFALETDDGGILIVGDTRSYGLGGSADIYLIKTDSLGNVQWANAYGGIGTEKGYGVTKSIDGNYVITGYTNSFGFGGYDAFLMKVDLNGDVDWFYTYGGQSDDYAFKVLETPDSGYVLIGGRKSNSLGGEDVYIIKTDKFGISGCDFSMPNVNVFQITNLLAEDYVLSTLEVISVADLSLTVVNPNSAAKFYCGSIPVELKSFNYKLENRSVVISWSTATETNNMGFKVLRNNIEIGFVSGHGTTAESKDYSFRDQVMENGSYTYSLIQVDYDGTTEKIGEIEVVISKIPVDYELEQNYPNPFNPTTKIKYTIPKVSHVSLIVYGSLGEEVVTLVDEIKEAGYYEVVFDGTDVPSGVYFYTLLSNKFSTTKKMILLK